MQSMSMPAFSDCRLASLVPSAFCNPCICMSSVIKSVSGSRLRKRPRPAADSVIG